ncbi:DNA polymerase III, beta subunit [Chitinophaga jiangningensis]|uniref:Beta sliding clamp n=1 Tax=Chitinophaga jiangningensis TaxID=1419482 RepID=A0A1M6WIT3_9BACT|nr:DNA polymerase III subunit beta [Chitinophaga jiangningensis]SHK93618.1 DNA polymerase III, beta subunit [Chitinophaga jiangningensis]
MNKFIINSKTLKNALNKLGQAVPKKPVLPVLSNVLCKVGEAEVEFCSTDLMTTIQHRVECEVVGKPFHVLLPFDFLKRVAFLSKEAPITIEVEEELIRIIGAMQDEFILKATDKVEDYPKLPAIPRKNFMTVEDGLVYWMNKALATVSADELRPALCCVCLDVLANGLSVVSTDAHSLFSRSFSVEAKGEAKLLVTSKMVKALEGFDNAEVYWNSNHVAFHTTSTSVIATAVDGKYPDYRSIIPTDFHPNLTLDREEMISALERCCLSLAADRSAEILLKEEKGIIRFVSEDLDMQRRIVVDIPGIYKGDISSINVSADRLLTLMHQVTYDKVQFAIHDPKRAILVTAEDDPDYLGLLMPLLKQKI